MAASDSEDEEEEDGQSANSTSSRVSNPRCKGGCYTLIRDVDLEQAEYALDLRQFFNCQGWNESMGGQSSYIARDEDEELLGVEPEENSLSLVYRDKESMKFVKYVNSNISES